MLCGLLEYLGLSFCCKSQFFSLIPGGLLSCLDLELVLRSRRAMARLSRLWATSWLFGCTSLRFRAVEMSP